MSTEQEKPLYTFEEYLEIEENSPHKNEYHAGEIVPLFRELNGDLIGGCTLNHSLVNGNILGEIREALKDRDCFIYQGGLKIGIEESNVCLYPDGLVICGEAELFRNTEVAVTNPKVIIEVLSERTGGFDLGQKRRYYATIPSLEEIVFVDQDQPLLQLWYKNQEGKWEIRFFDDLDSEVEIKSLAIHIPLKMIYHKVKFSGKNLK